MGRCAGGCRCWASVLRAASSVGSRRAANGRSRCVRAPDRWREGCEGPSIVNNVACESCSA
eukprot:scaffold2476_cov37-Phaeocystis_antarctica.AAC.4